MLHNDKELFKQLILKVHDDNKAASGTLLALSKVLECNIEDLLE